MDRRMQDIQEKLKATLSQEELAMLQTALRASAISLGVIVIGVCVYVDLAFTNLLRPDTDKSFFVNIPLLPQVKEVRYAWFAYLGYLFLRGVVAFGTLLRSIPSATLAESDELRACSSVVRYATRSWRDIRAIVKPPLGPLLWLTLIDMLYRAMGIS